MTNEPPIVKPQQDAKQGAHAGVKNVLIAGLVLVIVAFLIVFFVMK